MFGPKVFKAISFMSVLTRPQILLSEQLQLGTSGSRLWYECCFQTVRGMQYTAWAQTTSDDSGADCGAAEPCRSDCGGTDGVDGVHFF